MKTNIILNGDALIHLKEMPNESINCIMTSPPYWALRDYGVEGQLGLEPTFQEYINKLCNIFDEGRAGFVGKDGNTNEWVRPIGTGKCLICGKNISENRQFCSKECLNKKGN